MKTSEVIVTTLLGLAAALVLVFTLSGCGYDQATGSMVNVEVDGVVFEHVQSGFFDVDHHEVLGEETYFATIVLSTTPDICHEQEEHIYTAGSQQLYLSFRLGGVEGLKPELPHDYLASAIFVSLDHQCNEALPVGENSGEVSLTLLDFDVLGSLLGSFEGAVGSTRELPLEGSTGRLYFCERAPSTVVRCD